MSHSLRPSRFGAQEIKPEVFAVLMDFFQSGQPVLTEEPQPTVRDARIASYASSA